MARRGIQRNGIGQDPDIKDSGERVLEDRLGSGPVLSRKTMSFELKPANFFDRNPAVDLRRAPFEVRR